MTTRIEDHEAGDQGAHYSRKRVQEQASEIEHLKAELLAVTKARLESEELRTKAHDLVVDGFNLVQTQAAMVSRTMSILEKIYALACRNDGPDWQHVMRLCEGAGIRSSPARKDGSV